MSDVPAATQQGRFKTPAQLPGRDLLPAGAWLLLGKTLGLSPRELQVVQCVFEDQKQEAIAGHLGISPGTVNTYFQRLYTKLDVGSRPQLIVRVVAAYLLLSGCGNSNVMSFHQMTDDDVT